MCTTIPPKKILLAIDNSSYLSAVVDMATHIKWPAGTSVFLLAVVPEEMPLTDTRFEARLQVDETLEINRWRDWAATKLLADQVVAELRSHHFVVENVEICAGSLIELALEYALTIEPDLIIISAEPYSQPGNIWLNPIRKNLIQGAAPSVLVVRPTKPFYPLHTILAVENSPEAWHALHFVGSLSLPDWANVTLLYINRDQTKRSAAYNPQDVAEPFATEAISYMHDCGVAVRWLYRQGHPTIELLSVAQEQEANLIVIGAKGSAPTMPKPKPSSTQKIVKNAPCSVLVVREDHN